MSEIVRDVAVYGEPVVPAERPGSEAYAALAEAQANFPPVEKGRTASIRTKDGGSYSYRYADLADILAAVRKPLADAGFAVSQSVSGSAGSVGVVTRLLHRSGSVISSELLAIPAGSSPQDAGSAATYVRRYSLTALLGIATEDDIDGRTSPEAGSGDDGREKPGAESPPSEDSTKPASGFPVDPADCSHRFPSGSLLKPVDGRCPKCGTSWVAVIEGTEKDLGKP